MTVKEILDAIEKLPHEEQIQLAAALIRGFMIAKVERDELAEGVAQAIDATGILLVVIDDRGVRLRDAISDGRPRSALAHTVLEAVHPACERAISEAMGTPGTVVPGSVPS